MPTKASFVLTGQRGGEMTVRAGEVRFEKPPRHFRRRMVPGHGLKAVWVVFGVLRAWFCILDPGGCVKRSDRSAAFRRALAKNYSDANIESKGTACDGYSGQYTTISLDTVRFPTDICTRVVSVLRFKTLRRCSGNLTNEHARGCTSFAVKAVRIRSRLTEHGWSRRGHGRCRSQRRTRPSTSPRGREVHRTW